jgi:hypothetical protein
MRMRVAVIMAAFGVAALAGGGAALATSSGHDDGVTGAKADQARAAAVAYLGGGTGGSVELDGEHGATYDVEVKSDGGTTDVWLDASFKPITSALDSGG